MLNFTQGNIVDIEIKGNSKLVINLKAAVYNSLVKPYLTLLHKQSSQKKGNLP
jgi:antitoxin component of MazEF toxin-antitoxin module